MRVPPSRGRPRRSVGSLAAVLLAATACAPKIEVLARAPADREHAIHLCAGACRDPMELTYFGVSGVVLREGGRAVMTAPSFTNASIWRLMLPRPFDFEPDTALITRCLRDVRLDGAGRALDGQQGAPPRAGAGEPGAQAGERDPAQGVGVFRSGGARPPTAVMVAFIDQEKALSGVEPICRVLPTAPFTY